MALRDKALTALRQVFGQSRDERAAADSPSAAALDRTPPSMFSIWGRDDIGGLLTVSQALMDRLADYESMEEYPDIHCFAEGTTVYVAQGSMVAPVKIEELARGDVSGDVVAYNVKKKQLVHVPGLYPRLTGHDRPVVAVKLSNGETLRVTPDHKVLTVDGYMAAEELKIGQPLIGFREGFPLHDRTVLVDKRASLVEVLEEPQPDGTARVYDISTETLNFVANGVVCHNSSYEYFANDACQPNMDNGRSIWIASGDGAIQSSGNTLLHKRLRIEDDIWSMAYTTSMYGNDYEEVLVTDNGVVALNPLPVPTMRRVERVDGALIGYVQDVTGKFTADPDELRNMLASDREIPPEMALFEDWQVVHFRLRQSRRRAPYGYSIAEGSRWIWKRLVMLEDSMMIYKLTRAPARYAFYVDVTDVPPDRVESFLRKIKRDLKKKPLVDPRTGKLNMKYNPMANDEDFIIGVREGRELARIEVLSGPDYQAIDDVEYFKRMLHGSLKVPREYLGQEGSIPGRSILSTEDVRAARVTLGLQREIRNGVERILRIDLAARGIADPWKPEFEVKMTVPSGLYELAQMEIRNARADYASRIEPYVSKEWIRRNVFKLSDDEIKAIEGQAKKEAAALGGGGFGADVDVPFGKMSLSERKQFDEKRRLEDWRWRETQRNQREVQDRLDQLLANDQAFAMRQKEREGFFRELRHGALTSRNGHVSASPPARNGGVKALNGRRAALREG